MSLLRSVTTPGDYNAGKVVVTLGEPPADAPGVEVGHPLVQGRRPAEYSRETALTVDFAMRAAVHDRYGPAEVLRVEEVERPVPDDHDVLIRIHATTVSRTDTALREARPFFSRFVTGLRRPKRRILGSDLAGEVEAVGAAVTEFDGR